MDKGINPYYKTVLECIDKGNNPYFKTVLGCIDKGNNPSAKAKDVARTSTSKASRVDTK